MVAMAAEPRISNIIPPYRTVCSTEYGTSGRPESTCSCDHGGTATGATPSHTYAGAGSYTVTLTVTDAKGSPSATATTTASVTASGSITTLITDKFSRFSADGWGNADVGGPYRLDPRSLSTKFTVDGSRGVIELHDTEARKAVGTGLETYGLNVEGLISVSVDRAPDAAGAYHLIQAVHNEPLLDISGTSGIRVDASDTGQLNFPIRMFVDDFQYRRRP